MNIKDFDRRQQLRMNIWRLDNIYYYLVLKKNQNRGIWLIFNEPYWTDASLSHRSITERSQYIYTRKMTAGEKSALGEFTRLVTLKYDFDQIDLLIADEVANGMSQAVAERVFSVYKSCD